MSISSAMSNAVLGLRAAGRGAEVVSNNISNALTPGYGRRELVLGSGALGGVQPLGVLRIVDAGLAADKRLSDAADANAQSAVDFLGRVERLLGTPEDPASLSAQLSRFEGALVTATSRPDAPDRLNTAVAEARNLAQGLRDASTGVQQARSEADRTIAAQVRELNTALGQVKTLNVQITQARALDAETASLEDQRQQVVDQIGTLVPVREMNRENGQIALYSTNGALLIDGSPATIEFSPVNLVTAYMSVGAGTLSGLTINGQPIRTDSTTGQMRGGALSAQFAIRDELSTRAQTDIDALARDLVERFADPGVDPTLAAGEAGLFGDDGGNFLASDEVGLASRLTVNAAVDPEQGGAVWRLRDGINAAVQGNVGEASLLQSLTQAMTGPRIAASGSFAGGSYSASSIVSSFISSVGADLNAAEQQASFTSARRTELTQLQLSEGVDTDQELQRLIQVEQAYAANARMLEVLDDLMQTLNRL
jgi:flagellar hook-associated protein 1 FlgK